MWTTVLIACAAFFVGGTMGALAIAMVSAAARADELFYGQDH